MFGPMAAFCIIVVKILLQLVIQGSFSLGTGELQGIILSSCYVLPAIFIYHRNKTKKTAAAGMAVSTVLVAIVAVFDYSVLCESVWNDNGGYYCDVYGCESGYERCYDNGSVWNCSV